MIHPDTDAERQLIIDSLSEHGLVSGTTSVRLTQPYRLVNRAWRGSLRSDGYMRIVRLKK